jgi:dihydroorotase
MKPLYLKNVTIIDPSSDWHRKKVSILIENGKISDISDKDNPGGADIIEGEGLFVSSGWVDLRASFYDPGYEYKEDINSGTEAAAYGGFTGVAILPETNPVIATKSSVEYILRKAGDKIVDVYPLASVTTNKSQEDLTEMFDVVEAGASGFSSGHKSINDDGFLLRAMEYSGMTGVPIMVRPENISISAKGMVNEGIVSVKLGLKGIPDIAEETDINTLISLCEYTSQPIHISCVSTKSGMQLIEKAVAKKLPVTADVSIHHLYFEEEDVQMFDTNLKLRPPLRTRKDREYLRSAVLKNEFVTVSSDHNPHEEDKKKCEFEIAAFGAISLQTVFPQLIEIYGNEVMDSIVEILTRRSRKVLKISYDGINIGSNANITVFDPAKKWVLNDETNKSKSKNSPMWGKPMIGKAVVLINKGMVKKLD